MEPTIAGYTLHVAATNAGGRGGIGATDAVITGVGTIKDLLVTWIFWFQFRYKCYWSSKC